MTYFVLGRYNEALRLLEETVAVFVGDWSATPRHP
ncbi:MAG: tetratricopeptide repeat protein [Caldilineaceae bacterium]